MSEFDLVVVKAAKKNTNPTDTYRVKVKFMHGDADGETVKKSDFPVSGRREKYEPSLDEVLTYLKAFFDLGWNTGCDFCRAGRSKRAKILGAAGLDEDAIARCEEDFLWEGDITTDHQYQARPKEVMVTYFDSHGVEFKVDVFLKGTSEKIKFTS